MLQPLISSDPSGNRRLAMQLTRARANMRRHLHLCLYRLRNLKDISHFAEEYVKMMGGRSASTGQAQKKRR